MEQRLGLLSAHRNLGDHETSSGLPAVPASRQVGRVNATGARDAHVGRARLKNMCGQATAAR